MSCTGLFTAMVTPFSETGIDVGALEAFVEWQIQEGVHGLVPCGTTGESPTLTHDEHKRVVEHTIRQAKGRVKIMAGTGSNATAEAIDFSRHAEKAGADALLVVVPYYNKPTPEGVFQHYKAIADNTGLPIYVYNIPGRSVINLPDSLIARLAEIPTIAGLKDATGDLARVSTLRHLVGDRLTLLSGEDMTAVGFNAMGGKGCISVTSNVAPRAVAEVQNLCLAGDYKEALVAHEKLVALHQSMFLETNPIPVKYGVSLLGKCEERMRLPLVAPSEAVKAQVKAALEAQGLLRGMSEERRNVAINRKARFEYAIDDVFEAGIVLTGTEVKSLRQGRANIQDAYASAREGEIWLHNANIPEYTQGNRFNHHPTRSRKLLLHRRQILKLIGVLKTKGITLIPLAVYFNTSGFAKVQLGVAKGRKQYEKRDVIKERDWKREQANLLKNKRS